MALGLSASGAEASSLLARYDVDASGRLEIAEFSRMVDELRASRTLALRAPKAPSRSSGSGGGSSSIISGTTHSGHLVVPHVKRRLRLPISSRHAQLPPSPRSPRSPRWLHSSRTRAAVGVGLAVAACALPSAAGALRVVLRALAELVRVAPEAMEQAQIGQQLGGAGLGQFLGVAIAMSVGAYATFGRRRLAAISSPASTIPSWAKAWPWSKARPLALRTRQAQAPRSVRSILLQDKVISGFEHRG